MAAGREPTLDDLDRDSRQRMLMNAGMSEADSWIKVVQEYPLDDHPDEREQGMKRLGLTEDDMKRVIR
jgi:hypothetical protein